MPSVALRWSPLAARQRLTRRFEHDRDAQRKIDRLCAEWRVDFYRSALRSSSR
jgi:hypothetical protein